MKTTKYGTHLNSLVEQILQLLKFHYPLQINLLLSIHLKQVTTCITYARFTPWHWRTFVNVSQTDIREHLWMFGCFVGMFAVGSLEIRWLWKSWMGGRGIGSTLLPLLATGNWAAEMGWFTDTWYKGLQMHTSHTKYNCYS